MLIRPLFFMIRTLRVMRVIITSLFTTVLDSTFPPRATERLVRDVTPEALCARMKPVTVPLDRTSIGSGGSRKGYYESYAESSVGGTKCIALFPYRLPEVEACITEAKFHGSSRAAQLLGKAFANYLQKSIENQELLPGNFTIIPLPLSSTRLRERGYCQTERIAIATARALRPLSTDPDMPRFSNKRINENGLQIIDVTLLVRTRHTIPQTKLSGRERRKNLRGAFVATRQCQPHHTYIVLDDVITTGSTLCAAAEALYAAGAPHVIPFSMAHADLVR